MQYIAFFIFLCQFSCMMKDEIHSFLFSILYYFYICSYKYSMFQIWDQISCALILFIRNIHLYKNVSLFQIFLYAYKNQIVFSNAVSIAQQVMPRLKWISYKFSYLGNTVSLQRNKKEIQCDDRTYPTVKIVCRAKQFCTQINHQQKKSTYEVLLEYARCTDSKHTITW